MRLNQSRLLSVLVVKSDITSGPLILKEIPLHTRVARALHRQTPISRHARGRRSHHVRPVPIPSQAALTASTCGRSQQAVYLPVACAAAAITRPPGELRSSTIRISR